MQLFTNMHLTVPWQYRIRLDAAAMLTVLLVMMWPLLYLKSSYWSPLSRTTGNLSSVALKLRMDDGGWSTIKVESCDRQAVMWKSSIHSSYSVVTPWQFSARCILCKMYLVQDVSCLLLWKVNSMTEIWNFSLDFGGHMHKTVITTTSTLSQYA